MYEGKNNFVNKMKEDRRLLDIQRKFESDQLKEADLTETEKNNLIKLYHEQINSLKNDVENYNRMLNACKEKILTAKNKLKNIE